MAPDHYTNQLPKELSKVKAAILAALWPADNLFPGAWVPSPLLLDLTGQKYFDRRIRELRNECGCDIESGRIAGEHAYRLRSDSLLPSQSRGYLTAKAKKDLFEVGGHRCAVCGSSAEHTNLQADHRIPVVRGGSNDTENWQVLCVNCNVTKRAACRGCELDCRSCPWAYPQTGSTYLPLRIPNDLAKQLSRAADTQPEKTESIVIEAIKDWLLRHSQ